jgi:serine/threonine protein phosphatase PrpC
VWYQHRGETLGLAMSRSLGDAIVHKCGVSAEPEVLEHVVDDLDEFVIIATDGVWDVVDNAHAVQMVQNIISKYASSSGSSGGGGGGGGGWSPLEASHCVTKFARSRWEKLSPMIDDITCIVVKLVR